MAQTPQQRRANDKFAKHEAFKMGKPESVRKAKSGDKSPISPIWIGLLAFLLIGGLVLELLRYFF
ncbi:MAG: hypothetical protein M1834_003615 [Cirrosporium novae-zelandiae]|nr:MAG: hypothetical protein M1834_003615 [Cirrosporium novae-zelandiae]